nr:hypothetical protein [Tanacetum cinerariifolium]
MYECSPSVIIVVDFNLVPGDKDYLIVINMSSWSMVPVHIGGDKDKGREERNGKGRDRDREREKEKDKDRGVDMEKDRVMGRREHGRESVKERV